MKCLQCNEEINEGADVCTKCGSSTKYVFCSNCGNQMLEGADFCTKCGKSFVKVTKDQGEKYDLAIAAIVCTFIFNVLGLIFGIMVLSANKGKKNSAKSLGLAATIISGISVFFGFIYIVFIVLTAIASM